MSRNRNRRKIMLLKCIFSISQHAFASHLTPLLPPTAILLSLAPSAASLSFVIFAVVCQNVFWALLKGARCVYVMLFCCGCALLIRRPDIFETSGPYPAGLPLHGHVLLHLLLPLPGTMANGKWQRNVAGFV